MKDKPLTAKQQRFCEEYQIDLNATQAAIRAKYVANSLNAYAVIGCTNLIKVNIKAEIQRLKAITSEKTGITVEWVVNNLKEVAERCMQGRPVLDDEGREIGDWQFEHTGANKALQLLGMHVDAFNADNKSKAADVRHYTIGEIKALIIENDALDAEIKGITGGIAGEEL